MKNSIRKTDLASLTLLGVALTVGCQDLVEPREDPPGLAGVVHELADPPSDDGKWYELAEVEYTAEDPYAEERVNRETGEPWGRAFIWAGSITQCFVDDRGSVGPVGCDRIRTGDRVQVWVAPQRAILNVSTPPSYPADQVVIVRE
jgi:hypothetical protein